MCPYYHLPRLRELASDTNSCSTSLCFQGTVDDGFLTFCQFGILIIIGCPAACISAGLLLFAQSFHTSQHQVHHTTWIPSSFSLHSDFQIISSMVNWFKLLFRQECSEFGSSSVPDSSDTSTTGVFLMMCFLPPYHHQQFYSSTLEVDEQAWSCGWNLIAVHDW